MSWNLKGSWYESCSCKMNCRCTIGPAEPDQGWCSAAQLVELEAGESDGLDLSGARYCVLLDLPGDFTAGVIDKARLHFDASTTNNAQREAIEAIYHGKKGGVWAGFSQMIGEWLPSKVAEIRVSHEGEQIRGAVEGVGELNLTWLKTEAGKQTKLVDAPVVAAFEVDTVELATATGTRWQDPDMREWESLGFGGRAAFAWSA